MGTSYLRFQLFSLITVLSANVYINTQHIFLFIFMSLFIALSSSVPWVEEWVVRD